MSLPLAPELAAAAGEFAAALLTKALAGASPAEIARAAELETIKLQNVQRAIDAQAKAKFPGYRP